MNLQLRETFNEVCIPVVVLVSSPTQVFVFLSDSIAPWLSGRLTGASCSAGGVVEKDSAQQMLPVIKPNVQWAVT